MNEKYSQPALLTSRLPSIASITTVSANTNCNTTPTNKCYHKNNYVYAIPTDDDISERDICAIDDISSTDKSRTRQTQFRPTHALPPTELKDINSKVDSNISSRIPISHHHTLIYLDVPRFTRSHDAKPSTHTPRLDTNDDTKNKLIKKLFLYINTGSPSTYAHAHACNYEDIHPSPKPTSQNPYAIYTKSKSYNDNATPEVHEHGVDTHRIQCLNGYNDSFEDHNMTVDMKTSTLDQTVKTVTILNAKEETTINKFTYQSNTLSSHPTIHMIANILQCMGAVHTIYWNLIGYHAYANTHDTHLTLNNCEAKIYRPTYITLDFVVSF